MSEKSNFSGKSEFMEFPSIPNIKRQDSSNEPKQVPVQSLPVPGVKEIV